MEQCDIHKVDMDGSCISVLNLVSVKSHAGKSNLLISVSYSSNRQTRSLLTEAVEM